MKRCAAERRGALHFAEVAAFHGAIGDAPASMSCAAASAALSSIGGGGTIHQIRLRIEIVAAQ